MKKFVQFTLMAIAGGSLLTACSIQNENDKTATKSANTTSDMFTNNQIIKPTSLVSMKKNLLISQEAFKIIKTTPLPAVFDKSVVYTSAAGETYVQTLSGISKLTGVPIKVTSQTADILNTKNLPASGLVTFQGTLQKVLSQLTDELGVFWEYEGGTVSVYTLQTKVFSLDAPIGSFNISNTISSTSDSSATSGSSGSSGGSGAVTGTSGMNLDYSVDGTSPWDAAIETITNMLSANGKETANKVEGYVTVTDAPDVLSKVNGYIEKINDKTNKKIAVRVDVYDVETSATSDFGFDINALTNLLSNDLTISSSTASSVLSDTAAGAATSFTFQKDSSSSHDVVLQALNTLGKTTEVTGATVYTISGQSAPVQSVVQQNYLESTSTTVTTDVGTSTTLTPGTFVTGYNMLLTPRLQSNNQVQINMNLQLSTLVSLDSFSTGGDDASTIQLPKIRSKNFLESMILHSGQSILIAGFQDTINNASEASPTAVDMWYAGGAKSTEKTIDTTVIVITPYIIGG